MYFNTFFFYLIYLCGGRCGGSVSATPSESPTDRAFGKRMSVAVQVVRKKDAAGGRNTTSQFNINQFLFVKYGNRKNVTQGIPPLP